MTQRKRKKLSAAERQRRISQGLVIASASKRAAKHTPGPLKARYDGPAPSVECDQKTPVVSWLGFDDSDRDISEHCANSRLLAAAYTSYDRHCGSRAIECAEDDLLGEALEAIRDFAFGRKEPRECEGVMLSILRKTRGGS